MRSETAQSATQGINVPVGGWPIALNGASEHATPETVGRKAAAAEIEVACEIDPAELAARRKMATGFGETVPPLEPAGTSPPANATTPSITGAPPTAARGSDPSRRFDEQSSARPGLVSVFEHVDTLLRDIERAKAALAQRTAALTAEREAHHDVKMRHRLLAAEHERMVGDFAAQHTELERQSALASELESAIAQLQQSLADKTRQVGDAARHADNEREKLSRQQDEVQRGKAEMSAVEDRIAQLEAALSAAQDAETAAEADARKRDIEIAELRRSAAQQTRQSEEARTAAEALHQRLAAADEASLVERAETDDLRSQLQQEIDARRGDQASMQLKLDSVSARTQAQERALAEAAQDFAAQGQDLAAREGEARLLERLLREQEINARESQDALAAAEVELDALRAGARDIEASNSALSDHAEGLTRSLRSREKEGANWKHKVDSANERLRIETQRFEADRENFGQSLARLTAQLEQEKLARALAETALETARRDRHAAAHAAAPVRSAPPVSEVVQWIGRRNTL